MWFSAPIDVLFPAGNPPAPQSFRRREHMWVSPDVKLMLDEQMLLAATEIDSKVLLSSFRELLDSPLALRTVTMRDRTPASHPRQVNLCCRSQIVPDPERCVTDV
ncbi:hypothetical protein [Nakamurella leprariae]|uniref:Uncharacterized protein n=1 Tax=Nakamurella leprariae TaxID=2803911 RepID=A0A939BY18_9ACTN|nr:hypothetical protein [Nakamurella leprariae]MBM9469118.1 hypothetical protein [Nakamurella leprariae]